MIGLGLGSDKNHILQFVIIRQKRCAHNRYISLNYFATSHKSRTNILHHSKYSFPLTFPLIPLVHFAPATPSRLQHALCCDQILDGFNAKYVVRYIWTGCCASWAILVRWPKVNESSCSSASLPLNQITLSRSTQYMCGKLTTLIWQIGDKIARPHQSLGLELVFRIFVKRFSLYRLFSVGLMGIRQALFGRCWKQAINVVLQNKMSPNTKCLFPWVCPYFPKQRGPFV